MSEQDIIAQYFSHHQSSTYVDIGIGDDAAVVSPPENSKLVITTDTLNEGIHFHANCSPGNLGHKVLAVSLSDLAAMGASPLWATINLSIPGIEHDWLKDFSQGFFLLADQYDIKIVGGDLVKGPLSISIQAIGYLSSNKTLARSNAEVDDLIYVSGTIGDATTGLKLHELVNDLNISKADQDYFALRFNKPDPRINLGVAIAKYAKAAIDISDGLLIDLQRILSMSSVGAVIDFENIPLSKAMQRQLANVQDWPMLLCGGEDYELIFTADKKYNIELKRIIEKVNCPITEIGRIVEGESVNLLKEGAPIDLPDKLGFDHFS